MSDILQVLDRQTAQTEALIARLTDRLDKAGQLREMEQGRQQLAATIARLEDRMNAIDAELANLRRLTTGGTADVEGAAARLQAALTVGNIQPQPILSTHLPPPVVVPPPVVDTDLFLAPPSLANEDTDNDDLFLAPAALLAADGDDSDNALFLSDDEGLAGTDVTGASGDFAGSDDDGNDWSFGGGSLFSDAEELGDDDTDDWWGQIVEGGDTTEEALPVPAQNPFMTEFAETDAMQMYAPAMGAYPIPEAPQLPNVPTKPQRKGFLGRFF